MSRYILQRRLLAGFTLTVALCALSSAVSALPITASDRETQSPCLNADESRALRAWIVRIAETQIERGPTPKWTHRDCAGLIRFAVAEAFANHDDRWRRSMGMGGALPPDPISEQTRQKLRHRWRRPDGSEGAFDRAHALIQENTRFISRDPRQARMGDILFFDQGEARHLMLWTGSRLVYHNGSAPSPEDNGLRAVAMDALRRWPDTRWRPVEENPNFIGVFTFNFLR